MFKNVLAVALALTLFLLDCAWTARSGWAIQVVVPNGQASVAGNAQLGNPLACSTAGGERYQQVYQGIEVGSGTISAMAFRREDTLIFPDNAPIQIPNVTIALSSTTAGPDGLSTSFASNVGPDVLTVFGGTVTSFTTVTGPGLKPFDTVMQFATPFSFDATNGKNLLVDITVPSCPIGALISFDAVGRQGDAVSVVRSSNASSDTGFPGITIGLVTQFTISPPPPPTVVAAVLPGSRSVVVGQPATTFAAMISSGVGTATGCGISLRAAPPGTAFSYQRTIPTTNAPVGQPNTPVDIPASLAASFVVVVTPTTTFEATTVEFAFGCSNTSDAVVIEGVNTLLLTSTAAQGPDLVALAATATRDGIANIPGTAGTGAFAVATVNVGVGGLITATADTGAASLPVTLSLCQTNPVTGACVNPVTPGASAAVQTDSGQTSTFSVFATAEGVVPFAPGTNRVFVRFKTAGGATVGATSVAIRTQ